MGNGLRQRTSKKWLIIAILGLVALALVTLIVTRGRTGNWDTKSVSVVRSEAHETFNLEKDEFKHGGFALYYALQNNTDYDITIPTNVTIMQLTKGEVLADYSWVAKMRSATFLPARQRAKLEIDLNWGCGDWDITGKKLLKD
jgi:hypothetical protein